MSVHFRYNPSSCRYEPVHYSPRRVIRQVMAMLFLSFSCGLVALMYQAYRGQLPAEQQLSSKNQQYKKEWKNLLVALENREKQLSEVLERDNNRYRVMLDLPPLSPEQLQAGSGGLPEPVPADALPFAGLTEGYRHLFRLQHRARIAGQSLAALHHKADRRNQMQASRPAIQPVDKLALLRLHTTFGLRMHPVFGIVKEHKGIDFSLPHGAPVYATGSGRVSMAHYSPSYGNVVYIDHGFGYETRYAHLQRFTVQAGQYVKRGQLIGYVGNTGISVSPHLHYEVHYKGEAVNPLHFFQPNLSPMEYARLISESAKTEE